MQNRDGLRGDRPDCIKILANPQTGPGHDRPKLLTAIFTIELNCEEIAKPRRIARGLKGFHQNPGKSTNCKKTATITPRIGILSQSVRHQSAIHPKPWQCRHNLLQSCGLWWNCRFKAIQLQSCSIGSLLQPIPDPGTIDPESTPQIHNQSRLQLDCETTEDCIVIGRIALKLHGLYVSQGDQERQSIGFGAIVGLPHRFRFRPATSHTAPTYHSKLITQSTQSSCNPLTPTRSPIQQQSQCNRWTGLPGI